MKFIVTDDTRYIQITECTNIELDQFRLCFTKRILNWKFNPSVKKGFWDGYICFLDKWNRVPSGLWQEIYTELKAFGYNVQIDGLERIIDYDFDPENFKIWVNDFFSDSKIKPHDYQIDAAISIIKFRKSISEMATSAGKTLIIFMIFAYLYDKKIINRFMMVVPNVSLILQTIENFKDYNNNRLDFTTSTLYAESKNRDFSSNFIVGTYQSLSSKETKEFEHIDVICIDEAHYTKAKSIKTIITNCTNAKYCFGVTGTADTSKSANGFTVMSYLGPSVNNISSEYLISNKFATPINVKMIYMKYLNEDICKKIANLRTNNAEALDGMAVLNLEQGLVIENKNRLDYITNIISKVTKNSLVLFKDIKHKHGIKIFDRLKEICPDKKIFYVDGSISAAERDRYIKDMEIGNDKIIVASFGTFSTGISINNIHNIFFTESYKNDQIIRQSLGRGMRLLKGKDSVTVIDFVDDYSSGNHKNMLYLQSLEREKTYIKQKFPYKKYTVKF